MKTPVKVATYTAGLAVFFAAALWLGGRFDFSAEPTDNADTHTAEQDHGSEPADEHAGHDKAAEPGGLSVAADGYRLVTDTDTLVTQKDIEFTFRILGPDGELVTSFTPQHEKEVHLIVVRRDLTEYRHLHPEVDDLGTWRAPIRFTKAGQYRFFTDFRPEGADNGLTLGTDVAVAGDFQPVALTEPNGTATVEDYEITLETAPVAGEATPLTLNIGKDGEPVTDLEPYLGAYGHLVSLRAGDLAYLHVHPNESKETGPEVGFSTTFPTPGTYRLFFDFQHGNTVRTAEFTVEVTDTSDAGEGHGDGH